MSINGGFGMTAKELASSLEKAYTEELISNTMKKSVLFTDTSPIKIWPT
jgi:hypothetical protein